VETQARRKAFKSGTPEFLPHCPPCLPHPLSSPPLLSTTPPLLCPPSHPYPSRGPPSPESGGPVGITAGKKFNCKRSYAHLSLFFFYNFRQLLFMFEADNVHLWASKYRLSFICIGQCKYVCVRLAIVKLEHFKKWCASGRPGVQAPPPI
jgi:hypothetical protein